MSRRIDLIEKLRTHSQKLHLASLTEIKEKIKAKEKEIKELSDEWAEVEKRRVEFDKNIGRANEDDVKRLIYFFFGEH